MAQSIEVTLPLTVPVPPPSLMTLPMAQRIEVEVRGACVGLRVVCLENRGRVRSRSVNVVGY